MSNGDVTFTAKGRDSIADRPINFKFGVMLILLGLMGQLLPSL